jgi:type IV pilus assembly protein PilW
MPSNIGRTHRQGGFTLVELSVAMVIALFLIAGLFTIEQSTRKTSAQQSGLAELQDNERLAMTIMTDVIQAAGFFADPTSNTAQLALPTAPAPTLFATPGQGIYGATAGGIDSIYVQYMSQGPVSDNMILCNGQQAPLAPVPGIAYINRFSVQPPVGATPGQLLCTVSTNVASVITPLPNQPVVLVEGVENLQILYGVATTGANGSSVDTYMTAAQVTADATVPNRWVDVSAVKIILTFTNPLKGQPGQQGRNTVTFERVIGIMNRTGA